MAYFAVTYDLIEKDREDYQELYDELNFLQAHRYQESCWFVDADMTTIELRNLLSTHMEDKDRLMVIMFSTKPAGKRSLPGTTAWLNARFP